MIAEIFLAAAMSLPSKSFTYGPGILPAVAHPSIASLLGVHGHVLHVHNGNSYVEGVGRLSLNPKDLPFLNETFGAVFWETLPSDHLFTYTDVWNNWLTSAMRVVYPGGFLLFNEGHYVRWGKLLQAFGWSRLPFKVHDLSIYQKQQRKRKMESAA